MDGENEGFSTSMFVVFIGMAVSAVVTLVALWLGTKSRSRKEQ